MQNRYYLNYCTYSYSMAFWDWERWEKEIDWMAMHGINMPLSITGMEVVWYNLLKRLGYTTEEVNEFLVNNVRNIVKGAAEAYETKYEIKIVGQATSLMTTPKGVELLKKTASLVEGYGKVRTFDRVGGSEDATVLFKRAVEHGADGAFFMCGVNNQGHHKPDFDLQDVETMPPAILFCQNLVKQTNGINKN